MKRSIVIDGLAKSNQQIIVTLQELMGCAKQDDSDWDLLIRFVGIDEEVASAIVAFIQRRSWKCITLSYCSGPYAHLVIRHAMPRSESFYFRGGSDEGSLLHQVGIQLGPSELKHLAITSAGQWTSENLTALGMGLSSNTTLEVLELAFCWLDDMQVAYLLRGLRDNPSLRDLNFTGNECRSQGMLQLAVLLQSLKSQLQMINLSWQFVDEPPPRDPRQLQHDYDPLPPLLGGGVPELPGDDTPVLLGDSRDASEYAGLDIVAPLSAVLRTNQTLQRLDLSYNKLTDLDMAVFAHSLRDNTCLQQLSLEGNCFGPKGVKALLELMKSNSAIELIKIPARRGLPVEMEELQAEVAFLANWNRAGRRILLQNNVPRSLWSLIVERINAIEWGKKTEKKWDKIMLSTKDGETERASLLFCLLREAPALFERSICE
jgi:hypothetical protein